MKEGLNRLFSVVMALLLLLSTTSWTVGKHYCMGHLIDVSFFDRADDCGMDMPWGDKENLTTGIENSCCSDELIIVEGQDDLGISFEDLSPDQQGFLLAFAYSYPGLLGAWADGAVPNEQYPPPVLVKDIQLLDEVFLL